MFILAMFDSDLIVARINGAVKAPRALDRLRQGRQGSDIFLTFAERKYVICRMQPAIRKLYLSVGTEVVSSKAIDPRTYLAPPNREGTRGHGPDANYEALNSAARLPVSRPCRLPD